MSGSPSQTTERDTKLPGTPARKRHVQATNAWAQEQTLEAKDNFDVENVWSLAKPCDASTGGQSGDNGNNSSALSYRQNNENAAASERVSQATLVREKNSWAQEALKLNDVGKLLEANNHDKYTIKARARFETDPNYNEEMGSGIKIKTKPAVGTYLPSNKVRKINSATEPTLSKPFSMAHKMSLKGLRNVLTGTKVVFDDSIAGQVPADVPSVPSVRLDKASRVLGLKVQPDWQSGDFLHPPSSAQGFEFSSSYRDQTFGKEDSNAFGLKANDTPALRETTKPQLPKVSRSSSRRPLKAEVESEGILLGHGNPSPTKSGSYGTVEKLELVGVNFSRVASQQGIIETTDHVGVDKVHENQSPAGHPSSAVYSPSVYEGVWENHPEVGRSLPFFSPRLPDHAQEYHQLINEKVGSDDGASSSLGHAPEIGATYVPRSSVLTLASIISIATSLDENSSKRDSAEVLPLFAEDADLTPVAIAHDSIIPETNAVPPPPSSFPDYQASAPVGLAQAMMAIHHHIETSNDRLHRLVEDQNNRTHDELIRRCESLEEKVQKNWKGASKHDLNGLKNEFDILGHDLHVTATTGTETKRMIHTVLAKIAALDELVKNNLCKCSYGEPQRLADQEEPFFRRENTMFFNGHGAPPLVSSPGYLHVPLQHNANQFAHFGNSNSYGSVGTPQFHNEPSVNIEPRPREVTEEYYRASGHPQMMRAEVPEIDIHEGSTFFRKDEHCTVPFGIKGPNGVLYEMPSFMQMTSNGPIIVGQSPVSASTEGIGGVAGADQLEDDPSPDAVSPKEHDKAVIEDKNVVGKVAAAVSSVPTGIRMPNGIVYELPTFLHLNGDGQVEVVQDEDFNSAENDDAVPQADHMPFGIRMDNGVIYELPTFMHINKDGQAEVDIEHEELTDNENKVAASEGTVPAEIRGSNGTIYELPLFLQIKDDCLEEGVRQEESGDGQNILPTDRVPIGIRMDNGVLYELPSFMRINEEGHAEVNLQDEAVVDDKNKVGLAVGPVPTGIRGPNGVLYELPSFLRINDNGLEEVVQQEESDGEQNSANMPPTGGVPIGIRMDNGVVYEVPSFMHIGEDGLVEIDQYNEPGTETTRIESFNASDYCAWTEGSQGIWFNERATMEDIFDSHLN